MDGFEINEFGEIIRKNNKSSNDDYDIIIKEKRSYIDQKYKNLFNEYYKEAEKKHEEKLQTERALQQGAKDLMKSYDKEAKREESYNKALENKNKADEEFKKEQEKLNQRRKKSPKKNKVKRVIRDAALVGLTVLAIAGIKEGVDKGIVKTGSEQMPVNEKPIVQETDAKPYKEGKEFCSPDSVFETALFEGKDQAAKIVRQAGYESLDDYAVFFGYENFDNMYKSMIEDGANRSLGGSNGR